MGFLVEIKDYAKLAAKRKRLGLETKAIELMNLDEVMLEIACSFYKKEDIEVLDARSIELFKEIFSYGKETEVSYRLFLDLISYFTNSEVQNKIFEIYNEEAEVPRNVLDRLSSGLLVKYPLTKEAQKEKRKNKIKQKINSFTDIITRPFRVSNEENYDKSFQTRREQKPVQYKKNPFYLELSYDAIKNSEQENRKKNNELRAKIFFSNIEKINVDNFFQYMSQSDLKEMYELLNEKDKKAFIKMYINSDIYESMRIHDKAEVIELFKEYILPEDMKKFRVELYFSDEHNDDFERSQITDEEFLEYMAYSKERFHFFQSEYSKRLKKIDFRKILKILEESQDIEEKNAEYLITYLKKEEYEELLTNEKITDTVKTVTREKCIEYLSDDEKISLYKMANERKQRELIVHIAVSMSDEKRKILIQLTKDGMLKNRLKSVWIDKDVTIKESLGREILKSKDRIKKFLLASKLTSEYEDFLGTEEIREFNYEELCEIYKNFIEKRKKDEMQENYLWTFDWVENRIKKLIISKASFKEIIDLYSDGIIDNKLLKEYEAYSKVDCRADTLENSLELIEKINDIEIKSLVLSYIVEKKRYAINEEKPFKLEDLEKLLKIKISDNNVDISDKYGFLAALMQCYKIDFTENKSVYQSKMIELASIFKILNEKSGKTEYTKIFDFKACYKNGQIIGCELEPYYYENFILCMPYLNLDKTYDLLKRLYEGNQDVGNRINYKLLASSFIDKIDYNAIEFLSRYGEELYLKDSERANEKVDVFIKAYDRLKEVKTYPEEYAAELMNAINYINEKEFEKIDFNDESNIDLLVLFTLNKKARRSLKRSSSKDEENIFELYKEKIKKDTRKQIHSGFVNRRKALDAIGKRFFNFDYTQMKDLQEKYGADYRIFLDNLIGKAKDHELTPDENVQMKLLMIFRNIDELLKIKDTKALIRVFDEVDKADESIGFLDFILAEEEMKNMYSKDMLDKAYEVQETDKIDTIDGISVYSPKKFNMFVHILGAYGEYSLINENKSAKEIWNSPENKQNHILCTSYIGDEHICCVKKEKDKEEEKIILGFGKNINSEILMASQIDIGSTTDRIYSDESCVLPKFRTAKNIIRCCRQNHNEVDFERRKKDNKESNIEPEYVICFDEINEPSKKVAKDFGIPIILLNRREIAQLQSQSIKDKIKKFKQEKNPELLSDIVTQYQCFRSSFCVGDESVKLSNEFLSPEQMVQEMESVLKELDKEKRFGNKKNADNCYISLFEALDKELELCKEESVDIDSFSQDKMVLRKIRAEVQEIVKREKIVRIDEEIDETYGVTDKMLHTIRREEGKGVYGR